MRYSTRSMLESVVKGEDDFQDLQDRIKEFEDCVWSDGLQELVESARERGMSSNTVFGVKVLTYVLAGRVMVTFDGGDHSVTALAAEGEHPARMGLQGIDATKEQAHALVERAINAWQAGELTVGPDPDVGMGF